MDQTQTYGIILEILREEKSLPFSTIIKLSKKITGILMIENCHPQATKVYIPLTAHFQRTSEISSLVEMKSAEVSHILATIEKVTGLIEHRKEGKLKSWRKKV